jgi:hypothetical protein
VAGSKALGACIKRHRAGRPLQVVADAADKSKRWLAYVEAGKASPNWNELVAIASVLGPVEGPAFLDDVSRLLFEEAEVERLKRNVMRGIQRREFLGVLGAGALVDMERLGRVLQGLGVDAGVIGEMGKLTRLYADQSRTMAPGVVIPGLQAHMRNYLDLAMTAPEGMNKSLKAGAAEAAILTGVLSFRVGHPTEAMHYWVMASGLASESGHATAQAYAVVVRREMALNPANWGGVGGDPQETRRALDQGLAILGSKSRTAAAATFHAWRSEAQAVLGDAAAAARDIEAADSLLSKVDSTSFSEDFTGIGVHAQQELTAQRAACAVLLRQSSQVLELLEPSRPNSHPSPGWRAARMSDLAAAYAQRGSNDQAVSVLLEATDLAVTAKDPWRLRRLRGIRRRWLPATLSGETIQQLDHKLASAPN